MKKRMGVFLAICFLLFLTVSVNALSVKEIGSYYVGGKKIVLSGLPTYMTPLSPGSVSVTVDPNGEYFAYQMYVQYIKLEKPTGKYPLLMWHGGGLSGVTWETTPDGRPGWQWLFAQAGNDVYISDAVERGRATWARYPQINPVEPIFRNPKQAWESFRIGPLYDPDPAKRVKNPGTQFPVEAFEQFMKQSTPRWVTSDKPTQDAYDEYLNTFKGGAVIMSHSQGAIFAWNSALANPKNVKALIFVEPSPCPELSINTASLKNIPILYIYGDINTDYWKNIRDKNAKFKDKIVAQGNDVTWIEMPDKGVKGNTHMIMMDKNSADVAKIIMVWMKEKKLLK
jgi:pimeloyl-ACP methyl ester carboxylesterase